MNQEIYIINHPTQPDFCQIPKEFVFDTIYSFVEKLPYSMDPMEEAYISADLYNYIPDYEPFFQDSTSNSKYMSLFLELQSRNDTKRTSYVIQLCYVFQLILSGKIPPNYQFDQEGFEIWSASRAYQTTIDTILKKFPYYYEQIQKCNTKEERKYWLNQLYKEINISFESFQPRIDLERFYQQNQISYHRILPHQIKHIQKQIRTINKQNRLSKRKNLTKFSN